MTEDTRTLRVVLNAKSSDDSRVHHAFQSMRSNGHRVDVEVTARPGDAAAYCRNAIEDEVDVVVAAGGDGTVNAVVDALIDAGEVEELPSVAVLPLGTANDFAGACGIPTDPRSALRLAVEVDPIEVDIGVVNDACFINMASGGFATRVTAETPPEMKEMLGGLSYLLTGVGRFNEFHVERGELRGPDFDWTGSFYVLAVGNGRQAGGGITVCPEALLNDGLLDVIVLPEIPREDRLEKLKALFTEGLEVIERETIYRQLPWLEVAVSSGMRVNLDGEPIEGTSFRFEVIPERIRVHLPADAPLA